MTQAEIQQWLAQHGGAAGAPSAYNDAGDMQYQAADGNFIVVRSNGTVAQQGFAPTSAASDGSADAVQPAATGPGVSQQDVLAQLAAIAPGGDPSKLEYIETQAPRVVTDTSGAFPTQIKKNVPVRVWYDPATRRAMKFDVNPDGTFTRTFLGVDSSLPQKPTTADPTTPQGRAAAATATTDEIKAEQAKREAAESAANAALPPDRDPRYETNAARKARAEATIRQQGQDARAADADQRGKDADARAAAAANRPTVTLKPNGTGGTTVIQTFPDGRVVPSDHPEIPSDKPNPERVTVGGQVYERDPRTGQYSPAQGLPSEGEATVGGPSMTEITGQNAEAALRDYWNRLHADPNLTPAQREKYFQEAHQVASLAVQSAATDQNERESQRNAQYNVASTELKYMQDGMSQALQFTSGLIGKLPEGAGLGGQAFAAILGLQSLQMAASGIGTIPSVSTQAQRALQQAPTITSATLNDPAKLTAASAQIATHTAAAAAPAPAAQNSGRGPGEPPARANPPGQPVPAAAPATTLPAGRPDQTQAAAQIDNAISPPTPPPDPTQGYTALPAPQAAAPIDQNPGGSVLPQPPDAQAAAPTDVPPPDQPPSPDAPVGPPEDTVTIRNRVTGEQRQVPRSRWNGDNAVLRTIWQEVPQPTTPVNTSDQPGFDPSLPQGMWSPDSPPTGGPISAQMSAGRSGGGVMQQQATEPIPPGSVTLANGYVLTPDGRLIPPPVNPGVPEMRAANAASNAANIDPSGANVNAAGAATVNASHATMGALGIPRGPEPPDPRGPIGTPASSTLKPPPGQMTVPYDPATGQIGDDPNVTTDFGPQHVSAPTPVNTPDQPGFDPSKPWGMAPPAYPALAAYQPAPQQAPAAPVMSPALLHAQAAANPPWAFSEDQYNQMLAAGVPESTIFSIPGRAAA